MCERKGNKGRERERTFPFFSRNTLSNCLSLYILRAMINNNKNIVAVVASFTYIKNVLNTQCVYDGCIVYYIFYCKCTRISYSIFYYIEKNKRKKKRSMVLRNYIIHHHNCAYTIINCGNNDY